MEISKKWETINLAVAERMQSKAVWDLGINKIADYG